MTSDELLVSSPASMVGPNTPEAAVHRRMVAASRGNCCADCDDDQMDDIVGVSKEPIIKSRVRAYAFAQGSRVPRSKVTLESARAKLDRVKGNRKEDVMKMNLEDPLSDPMDTGIRGKPKEVKSKRFSVRNARAKLEAVKYKKEITNTCKTSPTAGNRGPVSDAETIDNELSREGFWVRHAIVKLKSARRNKARPSRAKWTSGAIGSKKRNSQRMISSKSSCKGRKTGEGHDATKAPDAVRVTLECVVAMDSIMKGKKQKAVRVSERIAINRLRTQQELLSLNLNDETVGGKTKLRRSRRNKREESSLNNCTADLSAKEAETEAINSERDPESFSASPTEFTPSVELTPSAKREQNQQVVVDISRPGARLSSGVECAPPVSPFGLIQEHLFQDPWKVLVACLLLNKTGGHQVHRVIWDFFEICPDAEKCVSIDTEKIALVIHSLGLQKKRARTLQHFSQDYLGTAWTNVTQLYGIGEYARDAYAIFCEGRWQEVQPKDVVLDKYWRWLSDTQGLGYGFSQIE